MDEVAEEIVVEEAASSPEGAVDRTLDRTMVKAFPARSADELLRALPGLHQSAHGGQGKAYQIFLRGFDAEHGTALAVDLEGIPLNEVNNIHGHGYLDLHVLPDLLVEGVELHAGVPRGEDGDFAVAGAATYRLGLDSPGWFVRGGGGTDRSGQGAVAWRPEGAPTGSFAVAEVDAGLGAQPQRAWRQVNVGAGVEHPVGRGAVRAFALGYDGRFDSPGALREADLDTLGFYGAYPGAGAGQSRRVVGQLAIDQHHDGLDTRAMAWGGWRGLGLDQNFTGTFFDPVRGDATRQGLDTLQGGGEARLRHVLGIDAGTWVVDAGLTGRHDRTVATIDRIDDRGQAFERSLDTTAHQTHAGGWAELLSRPAPWVSAEGTLRADQFVVAVDDGDARRASAALLSPRGRLQLTPHPALELSAAAGRALQSPEARAVVDGARAPVTSARVMEGGLAVAPVESLHLRSAVFQTDLDDELVFDHTVARYVSGGTTRRRGVTVVAEARPLPAVVWMSDVTFADARFTATGDPIPFAPRWLTTHGVYMRQLPVGEALVTGGVRVWTLGRRPLPSGFVSSPAVAGDLTGTVEIRRTELSVSVDNLLGNRWRDGEFLYPSRWDLDGPLSERPALHVTAGEPFAIRASIGYHFR